MQDVWLYRIVVAALALVMLSAMLGALGLAAWGLETPSLIVGLGSAASGALTGLLAPAPQRAARLAKSPLSQGGIILAR